MALKVSFNGIADSVYGLVVADVSAVNSAPERTTPTVPVWGRGGVTPMADSQEGPRTISVRGHVRGSSVADQRAKMDALKLALQVASIELIVPDQPTRYALVSLEQFDAPNLPIQYSQKDWPVNLRFAARYPYLLQTTPESIVSPAALPMGTGPVRPVMTLTGTTLAPVFTLKNNAAVTVATMTFGTLTMTAPDVLVVDCDTLTARMNGVNVLANLTLGDFFLIEPSIHANYSTSAWPTITVNAGTNTISYRRSWR